MASFFSLEGKVAALIDMASLEDHLRGDRKENYVGSSDSDSELLDEDPPIGVPAPRSDGLPQTGPKGVLTDYYRKLEEDQRRDILAEEKRKEMILKHSATVKSQSEDAAEAAAIVNVAKALDDGTLSQDPFLQQYRAERMHQLKKQASTGSRKRFGNLVEVRGDKYDVLIDNSPPGVMLIIHIYNEFYADSMYMNKCLTRLAKFYPTAKFCRVQCTQLGVSQEFSEKALPTLIVYCDGEIIGNHVRVTDTIGTTYEDEDLEQFLQKKKCLPPESEKEDPHFAGGPMGRAIKILGTSKAMVSSDDSD